MYYTTHSTFAAVKTGLDSGAVRKKLEEDEHASDFSTNPMARSNQDFVANQQVTTRKMIDQQVTLHKHQFTGFCTTHFAVQVHYCLCLCNVRMCGAHTLLRLSFFLLKSSHSASQLFSSQDASLESLGVAVDRLGQIGKDIHEEVAEQNVLLDSLGNEVDDAGNKMNVVTASLSKLLKTKDGCQIWTIVILTFILILLSKCSLLVHIICLIAPVPCQVF